MPANLPPQYLAAEHRYKEAKTPQEKIKALKEMWALLPKHKGTDKLQADLKRRLARHKEELETRGKGGKKGFSVYVDREGAGQVVLVGPPNVGKSQILSALTHAAPEVAAYPFTTRMPQPGMMPFENIQIQLVDLPPVSPEYMEPWVPEIIKHADSALLVVDLSGEDPLEQVTTTLEVLDRHKVQLVGPSSTPVADALVFYKKTLLVANKMDAPGAEDTFTTLSELYRDTLPAIAISARRGTHLEDLKRQIFQGLDIVRVYSKPPGKEADTTKPFTFPRGSTLLDFAEAIHKDFVEHLKFARVWGADKFEGQRVNKDYELEDGDVIELHL